MQGHAPDRQPGRRYQINRRRFIAQTGLGVAGVALASAIGCGNTKTSSRTATPGANAETPQSGGTLNVTQNAGPTTWDIHRTTSFYTLIPAGGVLSRLMKFKTGIDPKVAQDHNVEGDLAVSIESPDAVTWTIKLHPEAKFHNVAPVNGHAVESEDIRTTFTRALGPENPARGTLGMIDPAQIQAPDKNTVVFKLKYPYAPFNKTLASTSYALILPREVDGGYDPAKTLIGSGPWLLDSFQPDVAINVKRNPEWFGKPLPYVDGVHYAIIPDSQQRIAQFTSGNLDSLGESIAISFDGIDNIKRTDPKATLLLNDPQTGGPDCLFFQLGDPNSPFQDVRLRRAVSMAIDREALGKTMYQGQCQEGFYVGRDFGKWALQPSDLDAATAKTFKYDPAEVKQLLAQSGNADRQFKFQYFNGYLAPPYDTAAQTLANMLQTAGFKITLVQGDYQKDYIAGGKGVRYGNYPSDTIVFAGISSYTEADEFIFNYYDSAGTSALSRLKDPTLDDMIAKGRAIIDEAARVTAYKNIQKYLADKMYTVMGMCNPNQFVFVNPRVQNYQRVLGYGTFEETYAKVWLKR